MVIGARCGAAHAPLACRACYRRLQWSRRGLAMIGAPGALAQITDIHSSRAADRHLHRGQPDVPGRHTRGESGVRVLQPRSTSGHCETDVSVGSGDGAQLFGPAPGRPVSQSGGLGDGSARNPFTVTTTCGRRPQQRPAGPDPVETDTYVVGNEYYRTDMTLDQQHVERAARQALPRCRLLPAGIGLRVWVRGTANGAVACTQTPNDSPPALIEEFAPLTPAATTSSPYSATCSAIEQPAADFPNTCDCTTSQDNGMGLNWERHLASGRRLETFSMLSNFSPSGVTSLPISPSGGRRSRAQPGTPVGGTVATFCRRTPATWRANSRRRSTGATAPRRRRDQPAPTRTSS